MRSSRQNESGFSLIEMLIVSLVLPVLIGAIAMTVTNVSKSSKTTGAAVTITGKLRTAVRRFTDELRMSSATAEDANGNGTLDAGEDLNGNGRLEADWAVTASSITFNRFLPDGTFSLPITYRLSNGMLKRLIMVTPAGKMVNSIITRQVTEFTVVDASPRITIALGVWVQKRGGEQEAQTTTATVVQRN